MKALQTRRTRRKNLQFLALLLGSVLLWAGCATNRSTYATHPPQQITAQFSSIALLPVQFVNNQPDGLCHNDIGDDLRSTLARRLRERGYEVQTVPDRSPNSFGLDPPPPDPGVTPALIKLAPVGVDVAMGLWVEDYLATTLCEPREPKYLEMSVVMVLYALPEQQELGRWRDKEWVSGLGTSNETVWRVTMQLTDALLAGIP